MKLQVTDLANGLRRSAKRLGRGQRQRPLRPIGARNAEDLRENDVALARSKTPACERRGAGDVAPRDRDVRDDEGRVAGRESFASCQKTARKVVLSVGESLGRDEPVESRRWLLPLAGLSFAASPEMNVVVARLKCRPKMMAETDAAPGHFEKAHRDVGNQGVRVGGKSLENAQVAKRESGDLVGIRSVGRLLKRSSVGDLLMLQPKGEAEMQFGKAEPSFDAARR